MVRKKSVASKIKKRKETYKQKLIRFNPIRSWRILILVMKAVKIFLGNRRDAAIAARLPPNFGTLEPYFVPSNCIGFVNEDIRIKFPITNVTKEQFEDFNIVADIVKKLVSKVCRREYERVRQSKLREKKKFLTENDSVKRVNLRQKKQCAWVKQKYYQNVGFRMNKISCVINYFRKKYVINKDFHKKHNVRMKNKYHTNTEYHENQKYQIRNKYHINDEFRKKRKAHMKLQVLEKYHANRKFRELKKIRVKRRILEKYHNDKEFCENYKRKLNQRFVQKYNSNSLIRLKKINQVLNHYRMTYTPMKQNQRRLYNQSRRIMKKYIVNESHKCTMKHTDLYLNNLKEFRKKNQEGPDYVCISCRLALFRNQVMPYIEQK